MAEDEPLPPEALEKLREAINNRDQDLLDTLIVAYVIGGYRVTAEILLELFNGLDPETRSWWTSPCDFGGNSRYSPR